jgi:hypothetical protein
MDARSVDRNSIRRHCPEFRLRADVGVRGENANPRSRPTIRLPRSHLNYLAFIQLASIRL